MKSIITALLIIIFLGAFAPLNNHHTQNIKSAGQTSPENHKGEFEIITQVNGIQSHSFFDDKGEITRCRRYYQAEQLSPFIAAKVNFRYPRYKIFGITEVTDDRGLVYFIMLEDATTFLHVESTHNGSLSLKKKFTKASGEIGKTQPWKR